VYLGAKRRYINTLLFLSFPFSFRYKKLQKPGRSYFLRQKKLLIMIPALRITVKRALGDHPLVKLKVVAQNRWSLNKGSLTGKGTVTI